MWTWTYPTIEPEEKAVFMRRLTTVNQSAEVDKKFKYYKFNKQWFYFIVHKVNSSNNLPDVSLHI